MILPLYFFSIIFEKIPINAPVIIETIMKYGKMVRNARFLIIKILIIRNCTTTLVMLPVVLIVTAVANLFRIL